MSPALVAGPAPGLAAAALVAPGAAVADLAAAGPETVPMTPGTVTGTTTTAPGGAVAPPVGHW
jgi:hypothetical protein